MARIALVGHCGVDGPRLEATIARLCDDADITTANDPDALAEVIDGGADLLLFNRELGFGFDDEAGVDVIAGLRRKHPNLKMMLISDYPDAQRAAEAAGAMPGFGKAELGSAKVEKVLKDALA
jgi:two-component system, chemotaxis family, chemotaxis protein CheY